MKSKTKICSKCNNEFPLNSEHFFKRIIKNKLADGSIAKYDSFREKCKKCYSSETEKRRIEKRCKEMNCKIEDYRDSWKKQYSQTRTLYPEITHLPKTQQQTLRDKIKNGYVFTTYEQYKIDCRHNVSKAKRKYNYGDKMFVSRTDVNRKRTEAISDAYIANILRIPVNEIPPSVIETKRLIIQLKREI